MTRWMATATINLVIASGRFGNRREAEEGVIRGRMKKLVFRLKCRVVGHAPHRNEVCISTKSADREEHSAEANLGIKVSCSAGDSAAI